MGTDLKEAMTSYQTPDTKKEEFRKYLEKSGVIDAVTKVLVRLYEEPERPGNALDFIKQYLGASVGVDVEGLRAENDEQKKGGGIVYAQGNWHIAGQRTLMGQRAGM